MNTNYRRMLVIGLSVCLNSLIAAPASAIDLKAWDKQIDNGNQRFTVRNSFGGDPCSTRRRSSCGRESPSA